MAKDNSTTKQPTVKLTAQQIAALKVLEGHSRYDFIPDFSYRGVGSVFNSLEKRGYIWRMRDMCKVGITWDGRKALEAVSHD